MLLSLAASVGLTLAVIVYFVVGGARDQRPGPDRFEIRIARLEAGFDRRWVWSIVDVRTDLAIRCGAHHTPAGAWLHSTYHRARLERAANRIHRKASR